MYNLETGRLMLIYAVQWIYFSYKDYPKGKKHTFINIDAN